MSQNHPASVTVTEAMQSLRSGMSLFIHGAAATPTELLEALVQNPDLEGMRLFHLHLDGNIPFATVEASRRFHSTSLFTGAALRNPIAEGRADYVPVFLSDIPALFLNGRIRLDAALVQLSPPDRHGYCSLGTSVDAARAAVDTAPLVIAQINAQMPRTHGNTAVPLSRLTRLVTIDRPLPEHPSTTETAVEARIGELIADLIEDRSCLQLGIGSIPDAVARRLKNKTDLGIHTEMLSDGVVELSESGVITNRFKSIHPGRTVTSFVNGTKRLYDFIDDNPLVEFHSCDRTNDVSLIRKIDRMVAINSAIQIDLTGQICADSIGHRIYSGIGGQMDFMRGAAVSHGGRPIIAVPSTAAGGTVSRIVAELNPGAGVVTTRGHVHWVVTEYGAVNLHGCSLRERGQLLVSIAHPDFRAELQETLRGLKRFIL
ncbi:MAG: acetyl-CoA hydrolase/transferase family protein [Planctomycetes bacterium]|nr:acetyl-CoA hydrolase/transferase family protein [Planctomycetota bacterium]